MDWYIAVLKKYAVFEGRARRKEYWYFLLFSVLIGLCFGILTGATGIKAFFIIGVFYNLAVLLPSIAVVVRRLHDTGRSGLWFLIVFVPIIQLILIYFMILDSEPGDNRFGPNPKA